MTNQPSNTPDVTIVKVVPAPPRQVFEAWLQPETLRRFMAPAQGMSLGEVECDARAGGKFMIMMIIGGERRPHSGEYLEIVPHERLVFTWVSHSAGTGSHVTLTFAKTAEGHTRLKLEHFALPAEGEARARHQQGWTNILQALVDAFASSGASH